VSFAQASLFVIKPSYPASRFDIPHFEKRFAGSWNIATPFGFGAVVRHTASFIRPNRIARDLSGLPVVLGRFGPFEVPARDDEPGDPQGAAAAVQGLLR